MSKTKQDILCDVGILTDARLNNPFVHKAMDEYAAQMLSEYKEKLKDDVRFARLKIHGELPYSAVIDIIDKS